MPRSPAIRTTIRLPSWEVYAEGGAGPGRYPRFYHQAIGPRDRGPFHFRIKKQRDRR